MKFILGAVVVCFFSSCNLLSDSDPASNVDQNNETNNGTSSKNNNGTTAANNATAPNNQTTNNSTTAPNNLTSQQEIPFSSLLTSKRSNVGLVARWDFDDLSDKVGEADLSIQGDPFRATLLSPRGLRLSGATVGNPDTTGLSSALIASNAFTIELWLEPKTASQDDAIIVGLIGADGRNFSLHHDGERAIARLRTSDGGLHYSRSRGVEPLEIGEAFKAEVSHYVWTYDGTQTELWIDGKNRGTMPLPGGLNTWETNFDFAFGSAGDNGENWNGDILFASIYERALRPEEVAHHFALGSQIDPEIPQDTNSINIDGCEVWPFDLVTIDDIELFSDLGCKSVSGSVQVPNDLLDLSKLARLERVSGDLLIVNTSLSSLAGLESLTHVDGDLSISKNLALTDLAGLSVLRSLGADLRIADNPLIKTFDIVLLDSVPGDLVLQNNATLTNIGGLSHLQSVGGTLVLDTLPEINTVSLEMLTSVGTLSYSRIPLVGINLPNLQTADTIWIREMPLLTTFVSEITPRVFNVHRNPKLGHMEGFHGDSETSFNIGYNFSLLRLGIDAAHLGHLNVSGNHAMTNLDMGSLETIQSSFYLTSMDGLTSLNGAFAELTSIYSVNIRRNDALISMTGAFPKLTSVVGISIDDNDVLTKVSDSLMTMGMIFFGSIKNNQSLPACDVNLFTSRVPNGNVIVKSNNNGTTPCP